MATKRKKPQKYKPTEKDFEIFKKEFIRMQDLLNLKDWDVKFKFEKIEDTAQINWVPEGRIAIVSLNTEQSSTVNYIKIARHEVWHLFNSPLDDCARARFTTEEEIDKILEKMSTIMERYDLVEDQ